jgi:phage tail sheath protein FI
MPTTPTYPGVYIEEIPSGVRTITGVATSIAAFVGYTARGPLNKAVRVLSYADFERNFGGLALDSEVSYAVQQFFGNGGTDAYVVRTATGVAVADVALEHAGGQDALLVTAANAGAWANLVRLDVDYATTNPDSTFNLAVNRYELQDEDLVLAETELHRNLSMNSRSGSYAVNVVNSASKLIRLQRPAGLAFADRGFSRSGELGTLALQPGETTISGMLDGATPFTLTLTDPLPTDAASLVTRLTAAITAAGLTNRLGVQRVDALGAASTTGNHVQLNSQNVAGNPDTAPEFSSVQVTSASPKLKLGLVNGGREKEGASLRRPVQTGTSSADLADRMGQSVNATTVRIRIVDNSTTPAQEILADTDITSLGSVNLSSAQIGSGLPAALQEAIRAVPNPAAAQATVQLNGTFLRVVPAASSPNASIQFIAGGAQTGLRTSSAGSFENVQQYSLGTGADFGAQSGATSGADGSPPNGNDIIGSFEDKTGIYALRDVDLFNIMAIPRTAGLAGDEAQSVIQTAITFCAERRAFYIVDPDPTRSLTDIAAWVSELGASKNAAVYFPRVMVADPLDGFRTHDMPASGAIAGVYARTDGERGVWKAPAGIDATLRGVQGLSYVLTDGENGTLNPLGINSLRNFPVFGTVIWGARTLEGADQRASEWKYVPVRRLALYIEESLYRGTQWVVFEPNDEPLWAQIRLNVGAFMQNLFRQGAFQGNTPRDAYFVKCDKETTTQNDINLGIVNILVGFAPLKPAEFVIVKIQQMAGQIGT